MASDKGVVHIIDDDDALRESLAFLLRTAGIEGQTYRQRQSFSRGAARSEPELRDHRCAHAGYERDRPACGVSRS